MKVEAWLYQGPDGWVVAECPDLPGCISQGRTEEEALINIRDAMEGWLGAYDERWDDTFPEPAAPIKRVEVSVGAMQVEVDFFAGEDGCLVARVPAMSGCESRGRTEEEALANLREAIRLWMEDYEESVGWPFSEAYATMTCHEITVPSSPSASLPPTLR